MPRRLINILEIIIYILLILFSIFITYQLVIKIFGGRWETQDIVITLLVLMFGVLFNIAIRQIRLETDFKHQRRSFFYLSRDVKTLSDDFKQHIKEKH